MKIDKNKLTKVISEEIQLFEQESTISFAQLQGIVNKVLKKLDSIDMSLDLIYSAVVQSDEPIGVVRRRQAVKGRAIAASPVPTRIAREPAGE